MRATRCLCGRTKPVNHKLCLSCEGMLSSLYDAMVDADCGRMYNILYGSEVYREGEDDRKGLVGHDAERKEVPGCVPGGKGYI